MEKSSFDTKSMLVIASCSFIVLMIFLSLNYFKKTDTVTFCNVGQGDAAHIRIQNNIDIVIDTGFDSSVLSCIGKHMPFYDRTIEYIFITHPQFDHMGGLIEILERYSVKRVYLNRLYSKSIFFKRAITLIQEKKIDVYFPTNETKIIIDTFKIQFYWPTNNFLENSLYNPKYLRYFETSYTDPNDFSFIFTVKGPSTSFLFTGDASPTVLNYLSSLYKEVVNNPLRSAVLKVPHHGSKNGLTESFLATVKPTTAVISVGKNNRYGHPHDSITAMLKKYKVYIQQTNTNGDITFILK